MAALEEERAAKVLRQVEAYFSDGSLADHTFLFELIKESDDGLVDLAHLCSVKKIRKCLGEKEKDPAKFPADKVAAVAEVLRKSTLLKLSKDGKRVGPRVTQAGIDARSIAAHPIPFKMGMEKIEAIFKPHAEVKSIQLPKHKNSRIPPGFAVIEFSSKKEARKVLKLDLTYKGATLELEPKTVFDARKEALIERDSLEKSLRLEQEAKKLADIDNYVNEKIKEGVFKEGVIVAFTVKKIGASGKTKKAAETENSAETDDTEMADETDETGKAAETAETADAKGEDEEQMLSPGDIRGFMTGVAKIEYVDYSRGKESGFIRFVNPADARKLMAAAAKVPEGGLTISRPTVKGPAKYVLTFDLLEREAEEKYWKKIAGAQLQKNREGRGKGRGTKRPHDGEAPESKSQKTDDKPGPKSKLQETEDNEAPESQSQKTNGKTPKSKSQKTVSETPKSESQKTVSETPKSESQKTVSETPKSESQKTVSETPKSKSQKTDGETRKSKSQKTNGKNPNRSQRKRSKHDAVAA